MTKEIVCIQIGQTGVQISNALWELFCIEHGLDCQGNNRVDTELLQEDFYTGLNAIFQECQSLKFVPRSINVDLEPTVIDEIRLGPYKNLWHPDTLMNGLEDASNNFARGYFSVGKRMIGTFVSQLIKIVRECNSLHGFVIINSYGGGTGSGFSNLILDFMNTEFVKSSKVGCVVFPSPQMATAIVEPYNCILSAVTSIENIDLALLFDNEAIYEGCYQKMNIFQPTFSNVNRLISQVLSSLTVTLRFGSSLDHDLIHFQTNLIPYPQMHFPYVNYSPMCDKGRMEHKNVSTVNITRDLFDPGNQLIKCDVSVGKYMACCLQYRGLVLPREVNVALNEIKQQKDVQFVDWCPTGFKVGISSMPPSSVGSDLAMSNKNCCMFCNSSAIEQVWDRIQSKFNDLYRKKSFVHWYVEEGMEELEFEEIKDKISGLRRDYQEVCETTTEVPESKQNQLRVSRSESPLISNANSNQTIINLGDINFSCFGDENTENQKTKSPISFNRQSEIRYILQTIKGVNSVH